ncbi:ORF6C domain-containing protein [Gilliamella sp. B2776]|uniref:BRO family protein n=2 Tax=Gilliamella TaxID=1193503 RepID=UPI00226A466A|nr:MULTISPECIES: BRO family protein [unclassified Gilliamella]MCX8649974.1 ORF6C domain-containing protein [Gilliamella sp. B2779]MCX8691747.1 ORF6C domain-containing protein [Gilliamella sp. B2776]MCX8696517.1 ORF6C domain-containing protein [Gilliamella sp. B2828]MCX8698258.1 ORF6C domain-containing protein [Gilliamella sp. B3000]MCX8703012.1 ORF6C domain-containing protein [Gilliamella sp. B2781]
MSNLSVFNFHHSNVRIQLLNNEPLFCLTDVIKILNIKNAHASRFNFSEKGIHKMYTPTKGGNQELLFVNEPNLYRVIFRSNKKEAVEFQNWVFDEVLPTIRKTGSYSLTINSEQQQAIKQAVNERSYRTGEHYQAIYTKLYEQFKIPRYQDLPASKFDEAIKWLGGVHSRSGLSDEDWYDLAWLYKAAERMRYQIELIEPALRVIDSGFRGNFHSMAREYKRVLYSAKVIIERETAHIQPKNIIDKWNNVLPIIRHC